MDKTTVCALAGVLASFLTLAGILTAAQLCSAGCESTLKQGVPRVVKFASDGSYDWSINTLSDLGVVENSWVLNGSFFLSGILLLVFIQGVRSYFDTKGGFSHGFWLFSIGAACYSLVGVFTLRYLIFHRLVAMVFFIASPLGIILMSKGFAKLSRHKMETLSIATGLVSLLSITISLAYYYPTAVWKGFAYYELFHATTLMVWILAVSSLMIKKK